MLMPVQYLISQDVVFAYVDAFLWIGSALGIWRGRYINKLLLLLLLTNLSWSRTISFWLCRTTVYSPHWLLDVKCWYSSEKLHPFTS
uniref:Uncharacterized protein n=1 Tax=Anguilla anguilla TaxID=7936 RepID=A0A0E9PRI8_ANGAN